MDTTQEILNIANKIDEILSKHENVITDPLDDYKHERRYEGNGDKTIEMFELNGGNWKLQSIFYHFEMQDKYVNEYYHYETVKCEYLSDTFFEYLEQDKRVNDAIRIYNDGHKSDINFATYIMMFKYVVPQFAQLCLKTSIWTYFEKGQEYEFDFLLKNNDDIPTLDEFIESHSAKHNLEERIKDEEERLVLNDNVEGGLTADEFIHRIMTYKKSQARKNKKRVYKYDKNGNMIESYSDREQCMRIEGMSKQTLSNIIRGHRKYFKGYTYKEE